jgi:hypothetical protein
VTYKITYDEVTVYADNTTKVESKEESIEGTGTVAYGGDQELLPPQWGGTEPYGTAYKYVDNV